MTNWEMNLPWAPVPSEEHFGKYFVEGRAHHKTRQLTNSLGLVYFDSLIDAQNVASEMNRVGAPIRAF